MEGKDRMDSGLFLSNGKRLFSWILVPIIFSGIFYLSFYSYYKNRENALREEKSFIESAPSFEEKISSAKAILKNYDLALSKAEVVEKLNSQLKNAARISNLTLSAMNIEAGQGSPDKASVFKAVVKAEGNLVSITSFIKIMRSYGMLLSLDSVNIKHARLADNKIYNADIIFSYYSL